MELPPDTLLNNRYQIIRKLGQGGMGAVYLALDSALDSTLYPARDAQVAVKVNRSPEADGSAQFLQEARLLAALRHPNLPHVTDYFILNGSQYLVMNYIAGRDLENLLKEHGMLPLSLVLDWARQLGHALSYLHQQSPPVIHGDVKPANVRLSSAGSAILVDFGIAQVGDDNQAAAAMGYTSGYAPLEQYSGNLATGPNSDQYSFAALLYHLLTDRIPADSVQRALRQSNLAGLRSIRPDVPAYVQTALEKALSLRPDDRFASIDDLLHALHLPLPDTTNAVPAQVDSGSSTPLQVGPSGPALSEAGMLSTLNPVQNQNAAPVRDAASLSPTVAESRPRPPNGVLIGGLGLLVILFVGIVMVGGSGRLGWQTLAGAGNPVPVAASLSGTPQPTAGTLGQAAEESGTPPSSPSSANPAESPAPPLTATATLAVSATVVTPPPSETPLPLARGGLVVFASDRGDGQTLQLWTTRLTLTDSGQVASNDARQLTHSPGSKRSPVWSPDGRRLLYVAPGGEGLGLDIWLMNADGSQPVNLTQRKGDDSEPAWSPDGNWIAFTNNGRDDKIRMLYLIHPDGSGLLRLSTEQEEFGATWSPDMKLLGSVTILGGARILYTRHRVIPSATPVHDYFVTPQPFDHFAMLGNLGPVSEPAWSPDGGWVAYSRQNGSRHRIFLARYPFQLPEKDINALTGGSVDTHPTWSPDGQWILYNAIRQGNAEIYIMRATGQLQTNLTLSPSRDLDADWQPIP